MTGQWVAQSLMSTVERVQAGCGLQQLSPSCICLSFVCCWVVLTFSQGLRNRFLPKDWTVSDKGVVGVGGLIVRFICKSSRTWWGCVSVWTYVMEMWCCSSTESVVYDLQSCGIRARVGESQQALPLQVLRFIKRIGSLCSTLHPCGIVMDRVVKSDQTDEHITSVPSCMDNRIQTCPSRCIDE